MSIWGRVLGGAAGFALGGPIGAILGVMAGSAFDKKKQRSFNYSQISQDQKQQIFTISFIILSAKLAKSDGQVTNDEIQAFKDKFNVPKSELSKVGKIFNEAKNFSEGKIPYLDYFTHRLPLHQILLGIFFFIFGDTYLAARIFSVILSFSSIFLLCASSSLWSSINLV